MCFGARPEAYNNQTVVRVLQAHDAQKLERAVEARQQHVVAACSSNNQALVEHLLAGSRDLRLVEHTNNPLGWDALLAAGARGHVDIVQRLLRFVRECYEADKHVEPQRYAKILNRKDHMGECCLFKAAGSKPYGAAILRAYQTQLREPTQTLAGLVNWNAHNGAHRKTILQRAYEVHNYRFWYALDDDVLANLLFIEKDFDRPAVDSAPTTESVAIMAGRCYCTLRDAVREPFDLPTFSGALLSIHVHFGSAPLGERKQKLLNALKGAVLHFIAAAGQ